MCPICSIIIVVVTIVAATAVVAQPVQEEVGDGEEQSEEDRVREVQ